MPLQRIALSAIGWCNQSAVTSLIKRSVERNATPVFLALKVPVGSSGIRAAHQGGLLLWGFYSFVHKVVLFELLGMAD
jgi:hypothetical protein